MYDLPLRCGVLPAAAAAPPVTSRTAERGPIRYVGSELFHLDRRFRPAAVTGRFGRSMTGVETNRTCRFQLANGKGRTDFTVDGGRRSRRSAVLQGPATHDSRLHCANVLENSSSHLSLNTVPGGAGAGSRAEMLRDLMALYADRMTAAAAVNVRRRAQVDISRRAPRCRFGQDQLWDASRDLPSRWTMRLSGEGHSNSVPRQCPGAFIRALRCRSIR